MSQYLLLAAFIALPIFLAVFFRVNAVFLYLSLLIGKMLLMFVGDDAAVAVGGFVKGDNSQLISSLLLLLIPVVMTMFVLRSSMPKTQIFLHIPAMLAVGMTLYIFAVPLFSSGIQGSVMANDTGKNINGSQDLIVSASALIVLITMWITNKTHHEHHHKKHKLHK